jgi:EmrB/QacA subfamily drug resistance transporter
MSDLNPRRWWGLGFILLAVSIVIVDTTVLTVSIPTILRELHTTVPAMQWVIGGYALTYASLLVIGGRLADMFGPRRLLIAGATLFGIGSLIASMATHVPQLILGEAVIEGFGAALLTPATLSILATTFVDRERALAFAAWGTALGSGSAFGPLLGGYLTTYHSWRWSFRINVIIAPIAILGTLYTVRRDSEDRERQRLDVLGAVLVAAGTFSMVFGFTQGNTYGWWRAVSPFTVAGHAAWPEGAPISVVPFAFVAGVALLTAFVRTELRKERDDQHPLFEFSQFRFLTFRYTVLSTFLMSVSQTGGIFVLPLVLQDVKHLTPIENGLWVMPMGVCVIIGAQIGGQLTGLLGSINVLRWGLLVNAAGLISEAFVLRADVPFVQLLAVFVVYGLGAGLFTSQLSKVTLHEIAPSHTGAASAVSSTARQTGSACGAAILGSVFAAVARSHGIASAIRPTLLTGGVMLLASTAMTWRIPHIDGRRASRVEDQVDLYSLLEPADARLEG